MKTNKNYMTILNTETNYKEINEGVAYGAKNPIIPLFKKSVPSNIKKMWGISKKAEIEYAFANGYEFPFYVTTMPILYADCDIRYQRFINVDRILGIIAKFDPAKIEAAITPKTKAGIAFPLILKSFSKPDFRKTVFSNVLNSPIISLNIMNGNTEPIIASKQSDNPSFT